MVNGERIPVAKGKVILPKQQLMHNVRMPSDVARVEVLTVVPGCDDVDPPEQPEGSDSHMTLIQCLNWALRWPKTLISLGGTPHVTPSPSAPHSTGPSPLGLGNPDGTKELVPDLDREKEAGAEQEEQEDVDRYFNDDYGGDDAMPAPAACQKSLFNDTPPADTAERPTAPKLTPNTFFKATKEALVDVPPKPVPGPKKRKRPSKGDYGTSSSSQKPAEKIQVQPSKSSVSGSSQARQVVHDPGEPIVPNELYERLPFEMRILRDDILRRERAALSRRDQHRPVFTVQVPPDFGFVQEYPADKFYLEFEAIFNMFHLFRLDASLVRLWALHQARVARDDNVQEVAVADPFHMHENNLRDPAGFKTARMYLTEFMVANKHKDHLLVPYRPL